MRPALLSFLRNPKPFVPLKHGKKPPQVAFVQTDGSFKAPISRTAVILTTPASVEHKLMKTYMVHKNSMESEWCSIFDGIQFSLKKDEGSIELENDCFHPLWHLLERKEPKQAYLAEYYYAIFKQIKELSYIGIRWVPREMNRADSLFRI